VGEIGEGGWQAAFSYARLDDALNGVLALAAPGSGGFLADQDARPDLECAGHLLAVFVKKLHANAVTRAKFVNAVRIGVIRRIKVGRLAAINFRARHALSSVSMWLSRSTLADRAEARQLENQKLFGVLKREVAQITYIDR
jgi:hypothetical protein